MGKNDNRRTFKMRRKKSQAAKKARIKTRILAGKKATRSAVAK